MLYLVKDIKIIFFDSHEHNDDDTDVDNADILPSVTIARPAHTIMNKMQKF